ncbi:hypothetical protein GCM10023194_50600 [Planotetraspora phitsanulokensis]|uniref:Uncharacterized protein n=1 Tax=Planotetraspora phitsanulokensis TaxID=575192 RepID=A0A8J3XD42_9ACTN|nr:hypothetical protein [Planotetraspora phitsanulokensis]GII36862.1 hypothetical protein Pph01_18650 [Planotetraspora phitsanulokensis]
MGDLLGAIISLAALAVLAVLALLAISAAVLVALGALAATTKRERYVPEPYVGDLVSEREGIRGPGHPDNPPRW